MSANPGEGGEFFGRIPLFREFARLLAGESGPVNWELARQVAVATAAGAEALGATPALPSPGYVPEAGEQRAWDERLRLAELWVEPVSSLPAPPRPLTTKPINRPDWAEAVLPSVAPLVEPAARRMAEATGTGSGLGAEAGVPPEMAGMVGRLGGLIAGLQVGGVVGQLARLVLGQYDLAIPPADPATVVLLVENVAAFEQASDVPVDQVRLWLACHEVIRQRLFTGVDWLAGHLHELLEEMARLTEPDPAGLLEKLQDLNRLDNLQEMLEGGDLLGEPSPALRAATQRLAVLLALTGGYTVVLSGRVLEGRLPALAAIETAAERRFADPDGAHALFAQLLRADPAQAAVARGERFCREVLAATDVEGLDRIWAHPNFLPTPEELDAPGRWLERVGLVGGQEISLEEGLRALLGDDGDGSESGDGDGDDGEAGPEAEGEDTGKDG